MYCTDVHVLYRCACVVQMCMYCTDVHVLYRCACTVQMCMYCTDVHVQVDVAAIEEERKQTRKVKYETNRDMWCSMIMLWLGCEAEL